MEALISFVIMLIIIGLVIGVLVWAVKSLPFIPRELKQLIIVILVVIGALWLIGSVTGYFPTVYHYHRIN